MLKDYRTDFLSRSPNTSSKVSLRERGTKPLPFTVDSSKVLWLAGLGWEQRLVSALRFAFPSCRYCPDHITSTGTAGQGWANKSPGAQQPQCRGSDSPPSPKGAQHTLQHIYKIKTSLMKNTLPELLGLNWSSLSAEWTQHFTGCWISCINYWLVIHLHLDNAL